MKGIKKYWKRLIAMLLICTITLSTITTPEVQASENKSQEVIQHLASAADHMSESLNEGITDSKEKISAGDWRTARYKDNLSWNWFHNKVEMHIRAKYADKGMLDHEVFIKNKYIGGKLSGKTGRADLAMELEDAVLLWEIKPYSYRVNQELRASAYEQLASYVLSDGNFVFGGAQIQITI